MHRAPEGGGVAWQCQVRYAGQASTRFSGQSKRAAKKCGGMKQRDRAAAAADALAQRGVSVPQWRAPRGFRHAVEPATLARGRPARQVAGSAPRGSQRRRTMPTACG